MPYMMTVLGGNRVANKGVYLTHAIYYRNTDAAQMYLTALHKWKDTTDSVCVRLQRSYPALCGALAEFVAFQRDDFSDIQEAVMARGQKE